LHRGIGVTVSLLRTNHASDLFGKISVGISYFFELLISSNFSFPFPLHLSDGHFITFCSVTWLGEKRLVMAWTKILRLCLMIDEGGLLEAAATTVFTVESI
jgi:hypothetical protein